MVYDSPEYKLRIRLSLHRMKQQLSLGRDAADLSRRKARIISLILYVLFVIALTISTIIHWN